MIAARHYRRDTELGLQTHSFILSVKIGFIFFRLKALKFTA
jgi:hypothetical protein